MRGLLASAVIATAMVALWACSGDDDGASSPTADGGADVTYPPTTPTGPPVPLACSVSGTFDPCDAGLDPTVFYGVGGDAGYDASVSDAGTALVPAACVASGAVRIACANDAGTARFDLAAGDDGTSLGVAFSSDPSSRFTIAADGGLSAMTALAGNYDDVRIVAGGGTVATIQARSGSTRFTLLRDGNTKDLGDGDLQSLEELPAILGASADDNGTVYTLLNHGQFQALTKDDTVFGAKFQKTAATMLGAASTGVALLGSGTAGFYTFRQDDPTVGEEHLIDGNAFAVGAGAKGETLVALFGPEEDELQLAATKDTDTDQYERWRIAREPHCGLDQSGCGYTCTEKIRALGAPSGKFVVVNGASYFVYLEARETRTRTYSSDYTVVCGIFGGCACGSGAVLESVDELDVVALQVDLDGAKVTERARARVELTDPKTTLFTNHPSEHDVIAVPKGSQIHVGVQATGGEIARILLDLSK